MSSKRLKAFLKRPWNKDRPPSPLVDPDPARQTSTDHSTTRPLDTANTADSSSHTSATTSAVSYDAPVAIAHPSRTANAIVTGPAVTVADRPDTSVLPGDNPEPQNPMAPISQALAPPITATKPSSISASASEDSVASLQESLLVEAYKALKSGEPKVVDAYEKLLSVKVKDNDSEPTDDTENRIAAFTQEEWGRMKQMIEDGLKKRERSAAVYKKINDAIQFTTPIKPIITKVVQASPPVATAWVGVSLALEILINPLEESESSISGIAYVVSRMEWYWALVGLLSSTTSNAHLALQRKIEDQFSKLYQKLLLYQMKSICRYFRARFKTFCRDLGKLDDWDGQLEAIKTSEVVLLRDFRTYNDQVLVGDTHEMVGFLKTIDSSAEDIRKGLHYVTSAMECYFKLKEDARKDEKYEACRRDLFLTDPEKDKQRIIDSKDGLVKASCEWILNLPEFQRWKTNPESRRLWIRGDPGKGKTMLLCGIIEELERNKLERLCYFFCQATMPQHNNATSVLRGLVYQLVKKYPWLIDSVLAEYNDSGRQCFEDHNAWQTMSKILLNILRDSCMNGVLLIVDALDECIDFKDRRRLLVFIDRASSEYDAKWIISSRNWQDIEETLDTNTSSKHTLSLEMNQSLISDAVKVYIKTRVTELAGLKKFDAQTSDQVKHHLIKNSNDTFLWVALVCEALRDVPTYEIPVALESFPAGLTEMYERMMPNDTTTDTEKLRAKVLATISVVKRPITSEELPNIVELPSHISGNTRSVEQLVKSCGSFLNLQDGTIYFIHQSAADFLRGKKFQEFPDVESRHIAIFRHSLRALTESKVMKCNIYNIEAPGTSIEDVIPPEPNLLTSLAYSCLNWIEHLCDSAYAVESRDGREDYVSGILAFLQQKFLYWVEAFILLGHVSQGTQAIQKLATLIEPGLNEDARTLSDFLRDANRFVLYNIEVIEKYPLQLYASSLAFSPHDSIVRNHFEHDIPHWIVKISGLESTWDECLQAIETDFVIIQQIAFSSDGKWLACRDSDGGHRVNIWEADTGIPVHKLKIDRSFAKVTSISFFRDDAQLAMAFDDGTIQLWDAKLGTLLRTLSGKHSLPESPKVNVWTVAFSFDGCMIALHHADGNVVILDSESSDHIHVLPGHAEQESTPGWSPLSVPLAFSPDNSLVAAISDNQTINVWKVQAAHPPQSLGDTDGKIQDVSFSADSSLLASANSKGRIYVWDISTNSLRKKFDFGGSERTDYWEIIRLAFSPKAGNRLLAWAEGGRINVWDMNTATSVWSMYADKSHIEALSFLPDGQRLASVGNDLAIRVWDTSTPSSTSTGLRLHSDLKQPVPSSDGGQAICHYAGRDTIGIWNIDTGWQSLLISVGKGQDLIRAFSKDGERLAYATSDKIKVHNAKTGVILQTILNPTEDPFLGLAFRHNHEIASLSSDGIRLWDISTAECICTFDEPVHSGILSCLSISQDGNWLAYGVTKPTLQDEGVVAIWDVNTAVLVLSLDVGHSSTRQVAFSLDNLILAVEKDREIEVWDTRIGSRLWTLDIPGGPDVGGMSFDTNISTRLHTKFGYLDLNPESLGRGHPSRREAIVARASGYGTSPRGKLSFDPEEWCVMRNEDRVLWIPLDYQFRENNDGGFSDLTTFINGKILIWVAHQRNMLIRLELADP